MLERICGFFFLLALLLGALHTLNSAKSYKSWKDGVPFINTNKAPQWLSTYYRTSLSVFVIFASAVLVGIAFDLLNNWFGHFIKLPFPPR